ncbi:MAG: transporter substrate-binding domain-containing protein [Bacilli bacterium]|jgi:ABC-type amino acid transport substrate-binding protein
MKKQVLLTMLSVFAVASLSSCGSSSSISGSSNELVIGMEVNYAPFNWAETSSSDYTLPVSNNSGSYADGYDIQIAKLLGEKTGMTVKIFQSKWESLIPNLQAGTINAVIAGMTDTEEREQSISFTDEYYHSELVLVTTKETADGYTSAISKDDFGAFINGKMLVSQDQTVTDDIITDVFTTYGAIHNNPVDSFALAALNVQQGGAFAMTAEYPVAESIVAANSKLGIVHIDQTILGSSLASLGVSIGIKKGNTELQTALNTALSSITSDTRLSLMEAAVNRSSSI